MAAPEYRPFSILLTGGAGFIGSHVVIRLAQKYPGYKIVVLDKLDYCASLRNLESVIRLPNVKFVKGDLTSTDLLLYLLEEENVDTILHFAAQSHVDNSFGNSLSFTHNNVYGTHTLLESARLWGKIRRFVHVSTDEVYGEASYSNKTASAERATLEPTNPYSASKAAAEMLVLAYSTSYKLPCVITRGNNVYGPHQYPEKLIPKFTLLAHRGSQLPLHGDGSALRSFLYVTDVAAAFDTVLHRGALGEVYNIGTSKERSVKQVAHDVCAHFGLDEAKTVTHTTDRLFNDRRYFIDESKLAALGWAPQVSWEAGLKQTIDWYLANVAGGKWWPGFEAALSAHPSPLAAVSPAPAASEAGAALAAAPAEADEAVFLIYGRNGWIGGLLGELLTGQQAKWAFGTARLEDRGDVLADIRRVRPTHVLNAAGVTGRPNVDWCESHKVETLRTNAIGVMNLVDVCRSEGIHVTNFATGCIYSYDAQHAVGSGVGFTESDPPNFGGSFYSRTKGLVEEMLGEYDNLLQLRLRMPISSDLANGRNFVKKIVNYAKVVDIPNSMTVLDELLPISIEMARRGLKGIFNFTNPGVVSHNEVLAMYRDAVDPEYTWNNFSEEEQAKILAAPRSNNELDMTKLQAHFPEMLDIKTSLRTRVFEAAKRNGVKPADVRLSANKA